MAKKLLSLLICTTLILTLFSVALAEDKPSFTFWTLWDGSDSAYAQAMVEQFAQENNCDIEMVTMSASDFYTKMSAAGMTGESSDVAVVHVTAYVSDFQKAGITMSLTKACSDYGVDINFGDYVTTVANNAIIDNEYYCLPVDTISRVVAYNVDLLSKTSLLNEEGKLVLPTNYADFCAVIDTVAAELGDTVEAPIAFSPQNGQSVLNWLSFYEQLTDVPFFTGNTVTFDDAAAVKALETYAEFYQTYCLPGLSGTEDLDLFLAGQIPIIVTGTFNIGKITDSMGDSVGLTYFPQWFDEPAVTVNSHSLVLCNNASRTDEETKLALEFIKWFGENGDLWAKSGALPANQTVYSKESFLSLPGRADLVDALQYARALPKVATGQIQSTSDINTPVGSAVTGAMSAADAVKAIRTFCEEQFAEAE